MAMAVDAAMVVADAAAVAEAEVSPTLEPPAHPREGCVSALVVISLTMARRLPQIR